MPGMVGKQLNEDVPAILTLFRKNDLTECVLRRFCRGCRMISCPAQKAQKTAFMSLVLSKTDLCFFVVCSMDQAGQTASNSTLFFVLKHGVTARRKTQHALSVVVK